MATDSSSSSVGSNEVEARELPGSLSADIDDIGDIDSQLSRITISRDELRESLRVVIPRGYTLASALSPKEHFDRLLLEYRRHWQQQNVEGLMAGTLLGQKRKNYGFRPEEVVSSGSIETSSCRSSNLRCPIHAIFQLKNFDDCPNYIYDEFKPALRLASLFITAPALISYWVTLAYGERILDVELAVRSGHATYRIAHPVPPTSDKAAKVQGLFLKLAQHIHFSFRRWAEMEDSDGCWGSEHQAPSQGFRDPWTTESSVRLNTAFFVIAKRYSQLPFHDEASRLRFNLFFAVNICHEIAHAFERRTRAAHIIKARQNVGQIYDAFKMSDHVETHLYKNQQAEAGTAWEFYLFGGKIQPINQRCDCIHGLYTWSWDPANNLVGDIMRFSVPMAYVEEIQQVSTWIKAQELQQRDFFIIPRTGARSYNSVACATMALRQYIKTKEEEAAAAEEEEEEEEEDSSAEKRPSKKSKHNLSTI